MSVKTVEVRDILTRQMVDELCLCRTATDIRDRVVLPNMEHINAKTGQENDPMYISYALLHALNRVKSGEEAEV